MPEFSVKVDSLAAIANELWTQQTRLEEASGDALDIAAKLISLSGLEEVRRRLRKDALSLQRQSDSLAAMTRALDKIGSLYRKADNQVLLRQSKYTDDILMALTVDPAIIYSRTEPRPPWTEYLWWEFLLTGPKILQATVSPQKMISAEVMNLFRKG